MQANWPAWVWMIETIAGQPASTGLDDRDYHSQPASTGLDDRDYHSQPASTGLDDQDYQAQINSLKFIQCSVLVKWILSTQAVLTVLYYISASLHITAVYIFIFMYIFNE